MALDQTLDSPTQPTVGFCAPTSRFFRTRKRSNKRRRRNMEEEEYLAMCLVKLATGSNQIIKRPASSLSLKKYPTLSFKQEEEEEEEEEKIVLTKKTTDVEKVEEKEEKSVLTTTTIIKKEDDSEEGIKLGHTCNECYKSFSTHQGLGGHKASHRNIPTIRKVVRKEIKSSTIHKCNVCDKSFQSGQALGGHMRKHFDATAKKNRSSEESVSNKGVVSTGSRVVFDYDLNVAWTPEEEDDDLYSNQVLS